MCQQLRSRKEIVEVVSRCDTASICFGFSRSSSRFLRSACDRLWNKLSRWSWSLQKRISAFYMQIRSLMDVSLVKAYDVVRPRSMTIKTNTQEVKLRISIVSPARLFFQLVHPDTVVLFLWISIMSPERLFFLAFASRLCVSPGHFEGSTARDGGSVFLLAAIHIVSCVF